MKLGAWNDRVTETGLAGWVDIMKRQSMLTKNVDVKRLIVE
jgi:hypothetical protein